ncbi:MAG TPA: hypothetical protein VG405_00950 [Solirubrobacteraceae bacterium]|nr:hypothetical protein [Solirubrobacteraceae bacterium]
MHTKKILGGVAIAASTLSLGVAPAAVAGSLPKVSVRVEGKSRTLLRNKVVTPNGKRVRRDGHSCGGNTLLDPFNLATKGRWGGTWYSGSGWFITKVLGETHTGAKSYWEVFINHKAALFGLCGLKITKGQHLLMAAVPDTGTEFPTGITASRTATAGQPFTVHVVLYNAAGKAHALKGATVRGGGVTATTNAKGNATIKTTHTGRRVFTASKQGEIRSETVVKVAS